VVPLAQNVLGRWRRSHGDGPAGLSAEARAALEAYTWPGNVRELENVMQRAIVLTGPGLIEPDTLGLPQYGEPVGRADLNEDMRRHERQRIQAALRAAGGTRTEAADTLGISPRTLRHKLKQFRDAGEPIIEPSKA